MNNSAVIRRVGLLHIPRLDSETSGALRRLLHEVDPTLVVTLEETVGDQRNWIEETLRRWCDDEEIDLLLTIGGAHPAASHRGAEYAPEATAAVVERTLPGLAEAMRSDVAADWPLAFLHRGVCGLRGRTLVVNLPAGAQPAVRFLDAIADLLTPTLLHALGDPSAPPLDGESDATDESTMTAERSALQADEFAAYLRRPRDHTP